jgi:hypothetical protein
MQVHLLRIAVRGTGAIVSMILAAGTLHCERRTRDGDLGHQAEQRVLTRNQALKERLTNVGIRGLFRDFGKGFELKPFRRMAARPLHGDFCVKLCEWIPRASRSPHRQMLQTAIQELDNPVLRVAIGSQEALEAVAVNQIEIAPAGAIKPFAAAEANVNTLRDLATPTTAAIEALISTGGGAAKTDQARVGVATDHFVSDFELIVRLTGCDISNPLAFPGATIFGDNLRGRMVHPAGFGTNQAACGSLLTTTASNIKLRRIC